MKKYLVRAALGLMGLMGTLAIGVVNSDNELIVHDTDNGTITIYTGDFSYGITIADKNLGASIVGIGTDSRGFYFQWGNNHGNSGNSETVKTLLEWNSGYDNKGYDGPETRFILKGNSNRDIWSDNELHNNVWGGGNDNDDSNMNIVKGYDTVKHEATNVTGRQGPCPVGYHVPSIGEWHELMMLWCNANPEICDSSAVKTSTEMRANYLEKDGVGQGFLNSLLLPGMVRRRAEDGAIDGISTNYWSSSPHSSGYYAYYLNVLPFQYYSALPSVRTDGFYIRADGNPVRCFKNSYIKLPKTYTLTLHANNGEVTTDTLETDDEGKVTLPNATREADENGERVFEGWFAEQRVSEKIGNSGDEITLTADTELYAHWAQTITIWDPTNPLSGFTIMDRNLGATTSDITSADSYGFHYQWGNNYGFLQSLTTGDNPENFSQDRATYDGYGPDKPYNNPIFRRGSIHDYWEGDPHYDNLWGGENDVEANNWGLDSNKTTDRRGPCPVGYHVPSAGEWGLVIKYYRDTYATGVILNGSNGLYNFSNAGARSGFMNYFHVPFAGLRDYTDASLKFQGSYGIYWSSSPKSPSSSDSRYMYFDPSDVTVDYDNFRVYGLSLRCFKDTYDAPTIYSLTFDSQGGDEVATGVAVENTSRSRPENPSKSGFVFIDWYTTTGYESVFDFTGTLATGNLTVYAKWSKDCGTGVYFEEMDVCATKSADNLVYYRTDENGKDVISIKDPDSDTILTILDKNQGASVAGTNYQSYGYHYQWGNNTPFEMTCTADKSCVDASSFQSIAYSEAPASYENYWPGHSYNGSKFIKGNSDYWQDNKHYDNLWGGSRDTSDTTSVDTFWGGINNGDTRQGPCDTGYHVPSMGEWNALITYWYNTKNPTSKKSLTSLNNFSDSVFKTDFKLPLAGLRNYISASLNNQGSYGYYWSSSPYSASPNLARYLYLLSSNVTVYNGDFRALGYSVRCFKDSYDAPISYIIEFDANGGELLGADSEGKLIQKVESGKKAQEPVGISKDGAVFQNWVYSGDEATAFDFSAPVNSNSQLKAEWATLYTLTIHYVNSKGAEVYPDYTGSYVSGASYSVNSQTKEHYTIDKATISGVMGNSDVEETVTYSTETPDTNDNGIADEDEDHFTLTIHYVNSKGGTVFEDYTGSYVSGASYNIASTEKEHYMVDKATISGVMGNTDITETVTYSTQTEDTNDNGIADEDEDHFTLTIHYVNSKGGTVFEDYTGSYVSGASYNVASTEKEHYTIDKATISGVMGNENAEETVTYTPITDKNNNGIADEEDGYKPGSSGGGGGGGGSTKSDTSKDEQKSEETSQSSTSSGTNEKEPKNEIPTDSQQINQLDGTEQVSSNASEGQQFTDEQKDAYEFAKGNGITTMPTIQQAQMNGKLTRIAMAKMLSQYAMNVLGQKPANIIAPKFNDVTDKQNSDYDDGVTLAYQLGIMGQNMPDNKFRPNDEVTRAEFATALSRMIYNTSDGEYKGTAKYYVHHMEKLVKEGIITKDDPYMKELRGYVMIMLMRSAK